MVNQPFTNYIDEFVNIGILYFVVNTIYGFIFYYYIRKNEILKVQKRQRVKKEVIPSL